MFSTAKPSIPFRKARVYGPCWMALMSSAGAWAQTAENQTQTLDPVVVTATRGQDTNTVVKAKRIEVEQASSIRDVFSKTPEVHVSGGQSAAQKLYVRGLSERMLTVTIDGAAQPESAYHHMGQLMIEPELLKRVEIEAGTGAATAGPGALAGALRLITKNALDLLKPGEQAGGLLKAGYQSAAQATKLSATAFARLGTQGDILFSGTTLQGQSYKDGRGDEVPNSGSDAQDVFIKAGWRPGEHQRVELSHEQREEEGLWNVRTNLLPAAFNAPTRERTKRTSTALHYKYVPGNEWIDLAATVFVNDNRAQVGLETAQPDKLGTRSHGINISNTSVLAGRHRLTYGLNHRSDTGYADVDTGPMPDEAARVTGVFVEDQIDLSTMWQLTLGTRYDHYAYTDIKSQQYESSGASPSASLAFKPTDAWTLRATQSRALRGVGIVEPFLKQYQDNAAQISPEKARNSELSAAWVSGGWQLVGSVFRQRISNFIGYDDVRMNMGDVITRGFNASAGYKAPLWSASVGVSQAKPSVNGVPLSQDDSLLLGNSDGRTWVAQLDHQLPAMHLKLGWTGRLVEKLSYVPEGSDPRAGYTVHDVYAQWQPTGTDDVTLTFTVKNLFDKFYHEQSSFGYHPRWGAVAGFPEPGRDIRVSAAWRF
ncbi:TonB-dependent receptor [Aquabacterium sp.]|uniref:TonB-dependent receptor domain-containing protein n=1 Tax=Aquabacterium sp. TaxID=1872578 RepID=UPI00248A6CE6|nr:TonB-dependent receptor [Aquabacterium sp.]MDI1261532.1 TonB-dependent receptor [Aquabacterium sp.]